MNTQRTSLFLMANLGAEVSRIFSFKEKNEPERAKESLTRALGILQKVCALPEMKSRSDEMRILEEVLQDTAKTIPHFHVSKSNLISYFRPFALRLISA